MHRVRVAVPGPPRRGVNHHRISRNRFKKRCDRRIRYRRDHRPASPARRSARKVAGTLHLSHDADHASRIPVASRTSSGTALPGRATRRRSNGFEILDGYRRTLVLEDYRGYLSYDAGITGVQQCLAHLYRYLDEAYVVPTRISQVWTRQAGDALRAAAASVEERLGRPPGQPGVRPILADMRRSYDQAVACGSPSTCPETWHKEDHPGLILAREDATQGHPGMAIRDSLRRHGYEHAGSWERRQRLQARPRKYSDRWRTLSTLQRHCRIRSLIITTLSHYTLTHSPFVSRCLYRKHLHAAAPSVTN